MNRYEVTANLGEGTYGQVMKARVKATGEFVAIKKFKEEDDANTMREVNILRMLKDSEYIVRLHEMFRRGGRLHLVFEFAGDNLLQVLEASRGGVDVPTVKMFLRNTLRALEVCHSRNIIHRDLKPENLLVMDRDGTPFVKLCDFGCSRKSRPGASDLTDYVATRWYRSPELLCGLPDYGTPMDIWAVGCIAAELVTSHPLFPGSNESDTLAHVRRICGELPKVQLSAMQRRFEGVRLAPAASGPILRKVHGLGQRIDANGIDFLEQCLKLDPRERITAAQALAHPWLAEAPPASPSKSSSPRGADEAGSSYSDSEEEEMEGPKPAAHKAAAAALSTGSPTSAASPSFSPSGASSPTASTTAPSASPAHSPIGAGSSTDAGPSPARASSRKRSTQRRDSGGLSSTEPPKASRESDRDRDVSRTQPPRSMTESDDTGVSKMEMRALLRGEPSASSQQAPQSMSSVQSHGQSHLPKLGGAQQQQQQSRQQHGLQPLAPRGPPRDVSPSGYSDASLSPQGPSSQSQSQQQQYAQQLQEQAQQYVQQQHAAALAAQQAMLEARRLNPHGGLLPQRAAPHRNQQAPTGQRRRPSDASRGPLPSLSGQRVAPLQNNFGGAGGGGAGAGGRWPGAVPAPPRVPQGNAGVRGQPPSVAGFGLASNAYRRLAGPNMGRSEAALSAVGLGVRLPALGR